MTEELQRVHKAMFRTIAKTQLTYRQLFKNYMNRTIDSTSLKIPVLAHQNAKYAIQKPQQEYKTQYKRTSHNSKMEKYTRLKFLLYSPPLKKKTQLHHPHDHFRNTLLVCLEALERTCKLNGFLHGKVFVWKQID